MTLSISTALGLALLSRQLGFALGAIIPEDKEAIENDPVKWTQLYDIQYDVICDEKNQNKVVGWSDECILLCDEKGILLMLDRLRNPYNVALGDEQFENVTGGDAGPYNGENCTTPKSLVQNSGNGYIKICTEEKKVEVISEQLSVCPSGSEETGWYDLSLCQTYGK